MRGVQFALAAALGVFGLTAAQSARLGVKGGDFNIDGYNARGVDVFGIAKADTKKELAAEGKAVQEEIGVLGFGHNRPTMTGTADPSMPTHTGTWRRHENEKHHKRRHHKKHHRRHHEYDPEPRPTPTPIPYTTINGSVVPHPTYVFPEPTATPICGVAVFYVHGALDEESARDYLAAAASLAGIPREDLQLASIEYDPVANETNIATVVCGPSFDQLWTAANDPTLTPKWIYIGTNRIDFIAPSSTEVETVVFQCPDGTYLQDNMCITCGPSNSTGNCTQIVCTGPDDSTCKPGACVPGYFNSPTVTDCEQCVPVPLCMANATVCTTLYDSVCPPGMCIPPAIYYPPGVCV